MDRISLFDKFRKQDGGLVFGVVIWFLISSMSICFSFQFYGVFGFYMVVVASIYFLGSLFVQVMQWNVSGYLRFCCGCYLVKYISDLSLDMVVYMRYGRYDLVFQGIKYGQYWPDGDHWFRWFLGLKWYYGKWWMSSMRHRQVKWRYGSDYWVLVTERQNVCYIQHGSLGEIENYDEYCRCGHDLFECMNNIQNSNYGPIGLIYYGLSFFSQDCPGQMEYVQGCLMFVESSILYIKYNLDQLLWITSWWMRILVVLMRYQDNIKSISLSSLELFKEFII